MLQSPKFWQSKTKFFHPPTPPPQPPPHILQVLEQPNSQSLPLLKQCCKFSRRELAIRSNSLFLFLLGFQGIVPLKHSNAKAEENLEDTTEKELLENGPSSTTATTSMDSLENGSDSTITTTESLDNGSNSTNTITSNAFTGADTCSNKGVTKKAFLDVSIDGKAVGRIVIGLYGNEVPFGAARFSDLVSGRAGISYRRKEFVKILPNYVQHGGVRSYGVDAELAQRSGGSLESNNLLDEWERVNDNCPGTKNLAGEVSIIVRDPSRPPPKLKLVAKQGKLEIDREEVKPAPNATEFAICLKDSPELDASSLVVGRVLDGAEVVEKIGQVKSVNENTSSPYFRVAKLIGDKRAVVAERGFNRPYSKIVITNCGLLE